MMKIICVVGTRPEVIKMAPVYYALKGRPQDFQPILVATAQHRDMLDQILKVFNLVPDFDLNLMRPDQNLASLTGRILAALTPVLKEISPDAILLQGDTTTALAASLSAFYEEIPIGHIEAGLRTYNYKAPFPEEMNRRLVDAISSWCFAPTQTARQNLLAERIPSDRIYVTGNTVIDALWLAVEKVKSNPPPIPGLDWKNLEGRRLILLTGHRRESFGAQIREICLGLRDIADHFSDILLVYPVHLNPQVQKPVREILGNHPRIRILEPLDYLAFVRLMLRCHFIITDSGGIQEEAPSLGKPVLITRKVTERPEGVTAGVARLVGPSRLGLFQEATRLLDDPDHYASMARSQNPYGDGRAAHRIVSALVS
jgi:UDP-N-acetylglucosamine 2-epimerase (non-hydrolysing)